MSWIGAKLFGSLRSVKRPGDFCVGGTREIFMPTIDVDGVGRIASPVLPVQAEQLVAIAEPAPHGRGEKTVVDREVSRTWQVDSAKVRIGGRQWDKTLAGLVADVARGLGVNEPVTADFDRLLVNDIGSCFVDHRGTEQVPGLFATMVLMLPSAHRGGELVVKHLGREMVPELCPEEPSEIGVAVFFADCVRAVEAGCRLKLVYNLRFVHRKRRLRAPDYRAEQERVRQLLQNWGRGEDGPVKLILPLEHIYSPAELSFTALKGADAGVASVLVPAAAAAGCDLHLVLVSIEEGGSAEHIGYYGDRRWRSDEDHDDVEDLEFGVGPVLYRALVLSEWRRPDGGDAGLDNFPFTVDELWPPEAFDDMEPDEQHFHEATGDEGASFDRTYRGAAFVLWPAARRLAVLNQAGLDRTLPHLEDLTARWEASHAPTPAGCSICRFG